MGLEELGTFENAGLSTEEIADAIESIEDTEVTNINEIQDGLNATAIISVNSQTLPSRVFFKTGSFNSDQSFLAEPFILHYINQSSRVNTPRPLYYDYSGDQLRYDWHLTTVIDGMSGLPSDESEAELLGERAGRLLGEMNSVQTNSTGRAEIDKSEVPSTGTRPESDVIFSDTDWSTTLAVDCERIVSTAGIRFSDLFPDLRDFINNRFDSIPQVNEPRLMHLDYWWENLLWDDRRAFVIDWQRAYSGNPIANLPLAEYLLFDKYEWGSERSREAFRSAYLDTVKFEPQCTDEEWLCYEMYPRIREVRGFPYWWKDTTEQQKDKREEEVRSQISQLLSGESITVNPSK